MILYPSLHIKDGTVARLTRSGQDWRDVEILHPNPSERARAFADQGFSWLHIIDLNAAFSTESPNNAAITHIIKTAGIPVQIGGGIRDIKSIASWIDHGAARVLLTTAAVEQPDLVREACHLFPGKIGIKIDSRHGFVTTTGWTRTSTTRALDLALRVEEAGAAAIIHADINPDGALSEVNIEGIVDLAFALTVPVIASGGIQSLHEIQRLKDQEKSGIAGLILGRSLYNGRIDAKEALALAERKAS